MKNKYKKFALIWLSFGIIVTSILFAVQKNYNSKYYFFDGPMPASRAKTGWKSHKDKLFTYYEVAGGVTMGGTLLILAFGLKKNL